MGILERRKEKPSPGHQSVNQPFAVSLPMVAKERN
jgi:hypothetical protein